MIGNETIEQLLETGVGHFSLDPHTTMLLKEESKRRSHHIFSRSVSEWERIKRTTFFVGGTNLSQRLLEGTRWAPRATALATAFEMTLWDLASKYHTPQLATHFNRVGFNHFYGRHNKPACIPPHQDTEILKGVVAVIELTGNADSTLTFEAGDVALLACKNLCDARGIDRVFHNVVTDQKRTSLTFAQLGDNLFI